MTVAAEQSPPTQDSARGGVGDVAYREIKQLLLHGQLPLGSRLGEERIAERLDVSRTPVREALLRLHAERFLVRHPDGGYRVNHPTGRSMRNLYGVRRALELFALRDLAADPRSGSTEAVLALHDDWKALGVSPPPPDPDFVLHDEDFHRRLAAAAGNAELIVTLGQVAERIRFVRTHDFVIPGRIEATIAQHLEILEALVTGADDPVALLDAHILESQEVVEGAVGAALERMLAWSDEEVE